MKVLLDGYGGDNAPLEIVKGAVMAVERNDDLEVTITGKEEELTSILAELYHGDKITIVDAREVISNHDVPTIAVREKKDSSMVKALRMCREDDSYAGVVSAGSTGALLTGALFIIKRIKGISRPCLAPLWPTVGGGRVAVVDSGANADCKAIQLEHFALMGSCYMSAMFDIENPRVGLLNNGSEEGKGNELTKETYYALKDMKGINFIGNIEGRNLLFDECDVVVCDGFTGNIALKTTEGTALTVMKLLKNAINEGGIRAKLGALLLKPTLKKLKKIMDVNEQAGGAFLGVEKIVIKAHGSSTATSIANTLEQVVILKKNNIIEKIKANLQAQQEVING